MDVKEKLQILAERRLKEVEEQERQCDDQQLYTCKNCEMTRQAKHSDLCHAHNAWLSQINGRKLELHWILKELKLV